MKIVKLLAFSFLGLLVFISVLLAYEIIREVSYRDCGLSVDQSRSKVRQFLLLNKLPIEFLEGPISSDGTCAYDFHYKAQGKEYSFTVLSTWVHGVKLTYRDHEEHRDIVTPSN